jgi:hypothetical protein
MLGITPNEQQISSAGRLFFSDAVDHCCACFVQITDDIADSDIPSPRLAHQQAASRQNEGTHTPARRSDLSILITAHFQY